MKKGNVWILAVVAILMVAVLYHNSPAQSGGSAPVKVAVVDVIKVLTECQENIDFRQVTQEKGKKIQEERKRLAQESDDLKALLENSLDSSSEGYKAKLKEWFQKQAQLKAYEEGEKQVLNVESQVFMEKVYRKMSDEIASVARLDGYDLILDMQDEILKSSNPEQLVRDRKVLYHSANLDLTNRIIENLNRKYEAQKAGQG